MEVFWVIDRSMWQRGLLLLLLLAAAGAFYLYSKGERPASRPGASLVFLDPIRLAPDRGGAPSAEPEPEAGRGAARSGGSDEAAVAAGAAEGVEAVSEEQTGALENITVDRGGEAAPVMSQTFSRAPEFDVARIARLQARSRRIEALEETLGRPDLPAESQEEAQRELLSLARLEEIEREAEGLLLAQGFSDALVVIGEWGAQVVVPDVIAGDEASRIGELVARLSGLPLERIVIVDGAPAL